MKIKIFNLLCYLLLLPICLSAQKVKDTETYNYKRALEAYNNLYYDEAVIYFNKEIQENPNNGSAYLLIAEIRASLKEYDLALNAVEVAIKKISNKDKVTKANAHILRGQIYGILSEYEKAIADYDIAIKLRPDIINSYEWRGWLYKKLGEYDLSDNDYKKILSIEPGNIGANLSLGFNAYEQKKYLEALKYFNYVLKLDSNFNDAYINRSYCYLALGEYQKAMEDVIKSLSIEYKEASLLNLYKLSNHVYNSVVANLKSMAVNEPSNYLWQQYLGNFYEYNGKYVEAIKHYQNSIALKNVDINLTNISNCYSSLNEFHQALKYINQAIELDTLKDLYVLIKADILYELGRKQEAFNYIDLYISKKPMDYLAYYKRAWFKDHGGDRDGAIEDYTMSIDLQPDFTYAYLSRGILWNFLGNKEKAQYDFNKILELDTLSNESSHVAYAYFYLGDSEKALDLINSILDNKDSIGKYYDAACLFAVMGHSNKAIELLRKAFENGFKKFFHVRVDKHFISIRDNEDFINLVHEFELKYQRENISVDEEIMYEEKIIHIPIIKEKDLYRVKCAINGLQLDFILDTGASIVSLSSVEAEFMFKNKYLSKKDVIGNQYFRTADGKIVEGTVVNLSKVNFGGVELNNVKASIMNNQVAPLLLGQSVLNNIGKLEIDNENSLLKIRYKQKITG